MSNELLIGKDYKNNLSIKNKMGRLIWNICYWILFRPFPTRLFKPWRRYILKQFGAKVGKKGRRKKSKLAKAEDEFISSRDFVTGCSRFAR